MFAVIGNTRDEGYFACIKKMFMVLMAWKKSENSANYDIETFIRKTNECLVDNLISMHEQSCFLITNVRFSDSKINSIRNVTNNDKECKIWINYILYGWPRYRNDTDISLRCHWLFEYIYGVSRLSLYVIF